jgi:hypothetical protein
VAFHNTMVDRIVAARPPPNNPFGQTPSAEPIPHKALCILDSSPPSLPPCFASLPPRYGVHVRSEPAELQADITLKLLVCNGTHTPLANLLGNLGEPKTTHLTSPGGGNVSRYLESLFETSIQPALRELGYPDEQSRPVFEDWNRRLHHPSFGLSAFFITQNNSDKFKIRHLPALEPLLAAGKVPVDMAVAVAAMLAYATGEEVPGEPGVYRGEYKNVKVAPDGGGETEYVRHKRERSEHREDARLRDKRVAGGLEGGASASEASAKEVLCCDGSGQESGCSGGDPPNPPQGFAARVLLLDFYLLFANPLLLLPPLPPQVHARAELQHRLRHAVHVQVPGRAPGHAARARLVRCGRDARHHRRRLLLPHLARRLPVRRRLPLFPLHDRRRLPAHRG